MAKVLYVDGIRTVRGALDSVKEGQANRARWISRLRWQGEKSIAPDGSIWHEMYYMRMHEGAWSDAATRNREMIKTAQRIAHDIERDPQLREEWVARYAAYRATIPEGSTKYYHFFNFVYVTIYRKIRADCASG